MIHAIKKPTLAALLFSSLVAFADKKVQVLQREAFDAIETSQMDPNLIYMSDNSINVPSMKLLKFADWAQESPTEKELLSLYPGFVESKIKPKLYTKSEPKTEELVMFIARAKLIINKPAQALNLKSMVDVNVISQFDPEIKHRQIGPNQLITATVKSGNIQNFNWCHRLGRNSMPDPDAYIVRPKKETDLSYLEPQGRAGWCSDASHSICVESCFPYNALWQNIIRPINELGNMIGAEDFEPKDTGTGMESEVRYSSNEQEINANVSVRALTGLNTTVRSALEQNIFYFNQVMQFGKVLAVVQDHPTDPNKAVVFSYFTVAVKWRSYKKYNGLADVILGRTPKVNSTTGITAGLPKFTQDMLSKIANVIEKQN